MKDLRDEYNFLEKIQVWFGSRSVVVYTMGKVGTLTICNSLRKAGFKHVHPHSLRYTMPGIHFLNINFTLYDKIKYSLWSLLKRAKVFIWKIFKRKIVIITGVRDPFSRNISAFFEQAHYLGGIDKNLNFPNLMRLYNKACNFEAPIQWFDLEILKVTGINVYEYHFDKNLGYAIIENKKYKIFIYRLDKLNSLRDVIASFLNDDNFEIDSTNFSEKTVYSELMQLLKDNYRYKKEISNRYIASNYMKHFFTDAEIKSLEERWVN